MSIYDYMNAQRNYVESNRRLPHFNLIHLVDGLYNRALGLLRSDFPPRYSQFLLLSHQSLLSAATLIAQAQPFDASPITRRAIEIARVCLASKYDKKIEEKWIAFEKRKQRWKARREGGKLEKLPQFSYDYQGQDSLMKNLNQQYGQLSDAFVHLTPEYFAFQNWQVTKTDSKHKTIQLSYFITDQKTISRELILLAEIHLDILTVIDHCLDYPFRKNDAWKSIAVKLVQDGRKLGEL